MAQLQRELGENRFVQLVNSGGGGGGGGGGGVGGGGDLVVSSCCSLVQQPPSRTTSKSRKDEVEMLSLQLLREKGQVSILKPSATQDHACFV